MYIETELRRLEEADQEARNRAAECKRTEQWKAKEEESKKEWWEALVDEYGYDSSEEMALSTLRYAASVLGTKRAAEFFSIEHKTVRAQLERGKVTRMIQIKIRDRCAVAPLTRRRSHNEDPFVRLQRLEENLRVLGRPGDLLERLAQLEIRVEGLSWRHGDTEHGSKNQGRLRHVEQDVADLKKSVRNTSTDRVDGNKLRHLEKEMERMDMEMQAMFNTWLKILAGAKG